ncbi:PAS domain S-box protein [Mongoliibacter ruber]|uniref:histidine kinase n=1 Tax=Mongoliibacter ruber TaxID=1750599 RepID=A0A2T0WDK4_9BACT|nr:PAS domain S-box protein [Mongoliibacter ruber]PRY84782.1 PAS domain S-box-containing protein [Mongoliibacter ruber]
MLVKGSYTKSTLLQLSKAVVIVDLSSNKILFANTVFTELFGYEKQEYQGLEYWKLLAPEDRKRSKIKFLSRLEKDRNGEKFRICTKNQHVFVVEVKRFLVDFEGKVTLFAEFSEIPLQIKRPSFLDDVENSFYKFTNNADEIFWIQNLDQSQLIFVSKAFENILGRSRENLNPDKNFLESYVHPDDIGYFLMKMDEYKTQEKVDFEFRILKPDGTIRFLYAKFFRIGNSIGQIEGNAGIAIDITYKKQSESAFIGSDIWFKTIFYNDISSMCLFDLTSGRILDSNKAAETYFGYSKQEFLKLYIDDILETKNGFNEVISLGSNNNKQNLKIKSKKSDHTIHDIEAFCSLIDINGRELVYIIFHDFSVNQKFKQIAEAQDFMLKELVWDQSHALRAPLAKILSLLSFLKCKDFRKISEKEVINELLSNGLEMDKAIKEISDKTIKIKNLEQDFIQSEDFKPTLNLVDFNLILVDDDKLIHLMNKHVISKSNFHSSPISFLNGNEALKYIRENQNSEKPFLVFLDINMPEMNGWQFLEALEKEKFNSLVSVIMLSSSVNIEDKIKSKDYNPVLGFLSKPLKIQDLNRLPLNTDARSFHTNLNEVVSSCHQF